MVAAGGVCVVEMETIVVVQVDCGRYEHSRGLA